MSGESCFVIDNTLYYFAGKYSYFFDEINKIWKPYHIDAISSTSLTAGLYHWTDGDDVYYLEEKNGFVIVSVDGYIRTFFYPDDGLDYFNRQ